MEKLMDKLDKYQYNVEVGDVVEYKGKEYVIVSWDILCAGNVLRVFMTRTGGCAKMRWCKELWDEQVNELKVKRAWKNVPKNACKCKGKKK